MERGVACRLVAAVVVLAVAAPTASAAGAPAVGSASAQDEGDFGLPQDFDPDTVSLTAALAANGDAEWQFTYRMRLETDNETAAFEALQSDISANTSTYRDRFRDRITNTVDAAANATNREMSVGNVSVSTRFNSLNEESLGVVTYGFQWRGFAATDGDRVTAGDALEGFYLDEKTSLTVEWPSGYVLENADPGAAEPRERAVRWGGPLEFGTDQPRVEVAPAPTATTTATTTTTTATTATTVEPGSGAADNGGSDGEASGRVVPAAVGALVAVVVVSAAGWLYVSRRESDDEPGLTAAETATRGDGDTDGTAGSAGASDGDSGDGGDGPPSELLSNEERVEQFLEAEGGRAKQQAVVSALGWTEAKTSQVVSEMHENDAIEKFRIGRENVLKLPESDESEE